MQGVYVAEVERHLSALSAEEANLVATALDKVTRDLRQRPARGERSDEPDHGFEGLDRALRPR